MTNMDKLYEAVEARGPVCVGLDTDFSYLPADFVDSTLSKGENIVRFNKKLIDATKAVAGCYKVLSRLAMISVMTARSGNGVGIYRRVTVLHQAQVSLSVLAKCATRVLIRDWRRGPGRLYFPGQVWSHDAPALGFSCAACFLMETSVSMASRRLWVLLRTDFDSCMKRSTG